VRGERDDETNEKGQQQAEQAEQDLLVDAAGWKTIAIVG